MSNKTMNVKREWLPWLCENCIASSGEGGSLVGMRRWWGKDAYVVRCARILFRVPEESFNFLRENI